MEIFTTLSVIFTATFLTLFISGLLYILLINIIIGIKFYFYVKQKMKEGYIEGELFDEDSPTGSTDILVKKITKNKNDIIDLDVEFDRISAEVKLFSPFYPLTK